ncbi:MAG TPA: efflux RND transporter periplasmic adaptor subunit [Afifellaceae bacterium]|nr:efflux RND transporter periplasmic adaptor subunit [Afifellaceae bacterium]
MRFRMSYVMAIAIAAGMSWYMLTGKIVVGGQPDAEPPAIGERQAQSDAPVAVQVELHRATERASMLEIRGRTEADALVEVRAQTGGIVEERPVSKGQQVEAGELLCVIERGAREARLAQAQAQLAQAETDLEAKRALVEKGHLPRNQMPALEATVNAARATVAEAELELSRTEVRAPIAGTIQDPLASVGDVVQLGATCATIIDSDPINVIGQVAERDVGQLDLGMTAEVRLVSGAEAKGSLSYIASSADPQTRTFRVEIAVANPEGAIRDGITAEALVPLPGIRAHLVSSAYLTLDDSGEIGVRAVDENDVVRFLPVTIVGSAPNGLWVAGLPDEARIVTVGQEYVIDGQTVAPRPPAGAPLKPSPAAEAGARTAEAES